MKIVQSLGLSLIAVFLGLQIGLAAAEDTGSKPTLIPNKIKYRDNGMKPSKAQGDHGVTVASRALQGKDGTTTLEMTTGTFDNAERPPGRIVMVNVQALKDETATLYDRNYRSPNGGGYFSQKIPPVVRGQILNINGHIDGLSTGTAVVQVQDTVYFRPDLWAQSMTAPAKAILNEPVNISATIQERMGDTGALADAVLFEDGVEIDRANGIWVDAKGVVAVTFTTTFSSVGQKNLTVRVENVKPGDYDAINNQVSAVIEVVPPQVAMAYQASIQDWTYTSNSLAEGYFLQNNGSIDSNYDFSYSTSEQGWQQNASLIAWAPQAVSFPLPSLTVVEQSGATQVAAVNYTNLAADYTYSYTQNNLTYSGGCLSRFDQVAYATDYICTQAVTDISGITVSSNTTVIHSRVAGDVMYHSSGYDHYWSLYSGYDNFYSYNYDSHIFYGTRAPLASQYSIDLTLVGSSGAPLVASPVINLAPWSVTNNQPLTCLDISSSNYSVQFCSQSEYTADGMGGQAESFP